MYWLVDAKVTRQNPLLCLALALDATLKETANTSLLTWKTTLVRDSNWKLRVHPALKPSADWHLPVNPSCSAGTLEARGAQQ
jgi:hypothetical protein